MFVPQPSLRIWTNTLPLPPSVLVCKLGSLGFMSASLLSTQPMTLFFLRDAIGFGDETLRFQKSVLVMATAA